MRTFTLRRLGLVLALVAGCAADEPKGQLIPGGPPSVLQVFMNEMGVADLQLAYGCGDTLANPEFFDPDDPSKPLPLPACAGADIGACASPEGRPRTVCQERHQIAPEDDGKVDNAVAYPGMGGGQKIRIVMDELLKASTIEQFVCACAMDDMGAINKAGCPDPAIWASKDRSLCDDNAATDAVETSRFADRNLDGVPDDAVLLPGIVTIACTDPTTGMPVPRTYQNLEEDGWYNPSGNQQLPIDGSGAPSWEGLGPALVITPNGGLPTGSDCTLVFDPSIVDKNDNMPIKTDQYGALSFTTEPLYVRSTTPANNAVNVNRAIARITAALNVPLEPGSVANMTVADAAGMPVAGTAALAGNMTSIEWAPAAPLAATTRYTVTVGANVADSFGARLKTDYVIMFTTGM